MKTVLFVCNTLGQAGAEMAMMAMMAAMHRDGWSIDLLPIIPQGEMGNLLPDYVHVLGRSVDPESVHSAAGRKKLAALSAGALLRRGLPRLGYLWKSFVSQRRLGQVRAHILLWRVLADAAPRLSSDYDLAIGYLEGAATYYVADYAHAKVRVSFVHMDMIRGGYVPELDQASYRRIDHIFPVSDAVMTSFLQLFPQCSDKTSPFRNMIDRQRIEALSTAALGFTDSFRGLRLLSVGRLMEPKRYDVALEACAEMKRRGLSIRWYVIGTGDLESQLLAQRANLGLEEDFIFLGATTNPYPFVAQCDVFMQTTGWEGRSIALFEAQALCRPIIVSDCPGNLEQITHGVNGLVASLTPTSIADTVEQLLRHPEQRKALTDYLTAHDVAQENDLPDLYALLSPRK